jgi:hypothetical protein
MTTDGIQGDLQAVRDAGKAVIKNGCDPRIATLIEYWLNIQPADRLPGRDHFDPLDVPNLLPHLVLVDVERDPYRFRCRLMGTTVVKAFRNDLTGRYMDEALDGFNESNAYRFRVQVAETWMPGYYKGPATLSFALDYADVEYVHLPLASDGETVDMVLSAFVYIGDALYRDG